MKLTKKLEAEVMQAYDTWLYSYLNGDVKTYDSYLDDDYRFIGSTNNEEFLNRKDTTKFFETTGEQFAGITELRNETRTISQIGDLVFIFHFFDAWFLNAEEWTYYGRFRFTTALRNKQEGWRFVYQHFSMPDSKAEEGETIGFDQISAENLQLRDAIKRRTIELEQKNRELEIETALERVRARTMAMQKSEELHETSQILFQQMKELGEPVEQLTIGIVNETENVVEIFATIHGSQLQQTFRHSIDEMVMNKIYRGWKVKQKSLLVEMNSEEIQVYNRYRNELVKSEMFSTTVSKDDRRIIYAAYFSKGMLALGSNTPLSEESHRLLERFAGVFDGIYTRFLDLQKAEAQTREAQIEAALERVRSRTMGMHQSSELQDVIETVTKQLLGLGLDFDNASFFTVNEDKSLELWLSTPQQSYPSLIHVPYMNHRIFNNINEHSEQGIDFFTDVYNREQIHGFFHHFFENTIARNVPEERKQYVYNIRGMARSVFLTKNIWFQVGIYDTRPFTDEENNIISRFAKVFKQSYTRFLDLQKAEAQAKEAHIELALERVRARTMAMQRSDELADAAVLLFQQVKSFGLESWGCGFNIWEKDEKVCTSYFTNPEGNLVEPYQIPLTEDPIFIRFYESRQNGEDFWIQEISGQEEVDHYKYLCSLPVVGELLKKLPEAGIPFPTFQIDHGVNFSHGNLLFITYEPVPEAHEIFKRFGKVFDQTYTRFLDLQKAEAQAREAKIEAALEKVRSRSLAMHKSNELQEVIETVFDQILKLGILADVANFIIFNQENKDVNCWIASPTQKIHRSWHMPYMDIYPWNAVAAAKENGNDSLSASCSFEQKNTFFKWAFEYSDFKNFPDDRKEFILTSKCWTISYAWVKHTGIQLSSYSRESFAENENEILKRFAKVFEQSYIRFLDLQKAEAQAREAQIELGLERVRAKAMAMQSSSELAELVDTLFRELTKLDLLLDRCIIMLYDPATNDSTWWIAAPESDALPISVFVKYHEYAPYLAYLDAWHKRILKWRYILEGATKKEWDNFVFTETEMALLPIAVKDGMKSIEKIFLNVSFNNFGSLTASSFETLPEEQFEILLRFAKVFDSTYTRFNDLQKAEALAREAKAHLLEIEEEKLRAETALQELQAAQKQLIQSEKMASLGELTAGIAHEIQNPLNFVNNFSEVSSELIAEMKDELQKGNYEDVTAIANDVIQNLEKINHHGKRADAIVKGMLQHSRASTDKKELTDINALADEYLRLAYHGLRAKDKTFNATMKTDYDESIGNINIIPQDTGRVILNLLTNAFYAVNEKKKQQPEDYEPEVSVSTKKVNDKVEITVKDNGNGIPQKVLDKIFQPFFTTKPTGQGTGLGLSLAYDIIKAHNGEIKVETKEGEGTTFIIELPKTS